MFGNVLGISANGRAEVRSHVAAIGYALGRSLAFRDLFSSCRHHSGFRWNGIRTVDEEEIGGGPERGGNGCFAAGGEDDFEDFAVVGEFVEEFAAAGRRVGLD